MPTGLELWKDYEALIDQRRPWEGEWRQQAEFIRPNAKRVQDFTVPGTPQTNRLYDTTAPDACRKLASFLMGAVMSASTRWFSLITSDAALMRNREVAIWLDDVSTLMYAAFQQSNFNAVFPKVYASLAAMGTAAVYMEERELQGSGFNGWRFYAIPVGQFAIGVDMEGKVSHFGRTFRLPASAVVTKFGKDGQIPDALRRLADDKPYEPIEMHHILRPRGTTGRTSKQKPVASYYLEGKEKTILRESGYDEMPVFVPRWEVEEGEVYGRGPGHIALPDVRTLNAAKKLGLEALSLMVRPPLQAPHDGVPGGQIRITPAAINYVTQGAGDIKQIELGGDLKSEMVKGEELRQQIKGCFHRDIVDPFTKNYLTATEVLKTLDLVNRELGPTLGQIQTDLMQPLIRRAYVEMYRRDMFPEPPSELEAVTLDVEYEGPLARAQRSGDLIAHQQALAIAQAMAQADPEAIDCLDTDANVEYAWECSGTPMRLLRSKADRKQIRESRAQAAQAAAKMEQAQGAMDVAATGAQAGKTMQEATQLQGTA